VRSTAIYGTQLCKFCCPHTQTHIQTATGPCCVYVTLNRWLLLLLLLKLTHDADVAPAVEAPTMPHCHAPISLPNTHTHTTHIEQRNSHRGNKWPTLCFRKYVNCQHKIFVNSFSWPKHFSCPVTAGQEVSLPLATSSYGGRTLGQLWFLRGQQNF